MSTPRPNDETGEEIVALVRRFGTNEIRRNVIAAQVIARDLAHERYEECS
jgi:hypothetical protein